MSPDIMHTKLRRRYLESHTQRNRSRHTKQSHICNTFTNKAESDFYRNVISNISDNPSQLRFYINRTPHWKASVSLRANHSINSRRNSFTKHFKDKTTQIHPSSTRRASFCNQNVPVMHHPYTVFKPASLNEVAKLILSSPYNSCKLDPIPIFMLTSSLHTLIVPITKIIYVSLSSGVIPSNIKHVHLNLLRNKPSLQTIGLTRYRPISNLCFISKILEKVVSSCLNVYLNCNHLSNVFQSAYKQTGLLNVHNDI